MSQYQASPRQGHMEQLLHIFAFLKTRPKLSLHMDPDLPNADYSIFQSKAEDFHPMYRDAKDTLPFWMPDPKGAGVIISPWVDASHGMNKVTVKSHTGFIIFCN